MEKLLSLPDLSASQVSVLLDAIALTCAWMGDEATPRTIRNFVLLSGRIEKGQQGYTRGEVENMCYCLEIQSLQLQEELHNPLLSSKAFNASESDLKAVESVLALLVPLVPGHQRFRIRG